MFHTSFASHIKRGRHLFVTDSLFRNATYLTASTLIMSLLGFLFWIFIAHLYTPSQIGIASALISITTLISNISLLGLNSGIIRFLPSAKNQSGDINAASLVVGGTTLLTAAAYAFIGVHISGHVGLLATNGSRLAFTILMVAVSLNSVTDAIFIARRRGEYHTAGYAMLGLVKLALPVLLVSFGALGIFAAFIMAVIASLLLSYYLLWRGCDYHFFTRPNWSIIKQTRKYATHNYLGTVIGGLPSQLMPLFIIRWVSTSSVAYFSMAWTMANLLYIVPSAAMQSLLAEASNAPDKKADLIKRSFRMLTLILVPAIILAVFIAPHLLGVFGKQYEKQGTVIFQLFALSTVFMAISIAGNAILNIERQTSGIVWSQITNVIVTFACALWLGRHSLSGIGIAFLLGNLASALVYVSLLIRLRIQKKSPKIEQSLSPFTSHNAHKVLALALQLYSIGNFTFSKLTNGSNNITLLIAHDGTKSVLRIYKLGAKQDQDIENEIAFMEYLNSQGLPIPSVLRNNSGNKLSRMTVDSHVWQYILMDYAKGEHPETYSAAVISDMATFQAKIHLNGLSYTGSHDRSRRLRPRLTQTSRALSSTSLPFGYSHFDYDASNVLFIDNRLSSILDFEGMRYGPLLVCMYFTLKKIYELDDNISLPLAYIHEYQRSRKLNVIEKTLLVLLLSLRFRDYRFMRALTV